MFCRIADLRHKEVINSSNGCRIGYVDDVEIDTKTSTVRSIIIFGHSRWFGFFGKYDDVIIPWCDISLIGEDTILVSTNVTYQQKKVKPPKLFG